MTAVAQQAVPARRTGDAGAPILQVDDVTRRFGEVAAVQGVSFAAHPGQVIGLLGHNGAGKTTLVRLLSGLLAPTSGQVRVFGVDPVAEGPAVRRRLGVLPSSQLVDLRLTARENLVFAARLYGVPDPDERIAGLLGDFGLAGRADERVSTFSAGMRQRTALARVLLHEPEVLLLDEPSAALDPVGARELREVIRSSARTDGRTVLICTHDLNEASELCDRVIILGRGSVLAEGSPRELADRMAGSARVVLEVHPEDVAATRPLLADRAVVEEVAGARFHLAGVDRTAIPVLIADLAAAGMRILAVEPERTTLADMYFSVHADTDDSTGEPA